MKDSNLFLLERSKALQESWEKDTAVLRNKNINLKKRNTSHFNISGIKVISHWEAWCSPKLNVKYHGYYNFPLLEK